MTKSITINLDTDAPSGPTVAEAMARKTPLGLFKEYELPAEVIEAANRSRQISL